MITYPWQKLRVLKISERPPCIYHQIIDPNKLQTKLFVFIYTIAEHFARHFQWSLCHNTVFENIHISWEGWIKYCLITWHCFGTVHDLSTNFVTAQNSMKQFRNSMCANIKVISSGILWLHFNIKVPFSYIHGNIVASLGYHTLGQ